MCLFVRYVQIQIAWGKTKNYHHDNSFYKIKNTKQTMDPFACWNSMTCWMWPSNAKYAILFHVISWNLDLYCKDVHESLSVIYTTVLMPWYFNEPCCLNHARTFDFLHHFQVSIFELTYVCLSFNHSCYLKQTLSNNTNNITWLDYTIYFFELSTQCYSSPVNRPTKEA